MPSYSVRGNQAAGATKTIVGITGGTGVMPRVMFVEIGFPGAGDEQFEVRGKRSTAAGSSTPVTPSKKDPNSPAAETTAGENHTAEPTYTAGDEPLIFPGINRRGRAQWFAWDKDDEIIVPTTANAGFGLQIISGSAVSTGAHLQFRE